ncbi:MAG: protein-L-isoaspartate(D-aspartate) O-methyltransferase [Acidobacteriota bacterium]|nr:protein-L-isoaspartate(D-aspartate) O-methyltransferase [Acidobacteriota bacterium]
MKPKGVINWFVILAILVGFCLPGGCEGEPRGDEYRVEQTAMVRLIELYGVTEKRILQAMNKVRRHLFIPASYRWRCEPYGDHPCPIGYGQTISQPFIVAYMTWKLNPQKGEKVLEIGTGSGYQAAVLAEMGVDVYSIEIVKGLFEHAQAALAAEGYETVHLLRGDGYKGWPEYAPFDAVMVTCAPDSVPPKLVEQLKEGGRMILPVGSWNQRLVILRKKKGKIVQEEDLPVRFVPMVHE